MVRVLVVDDSIPFRRFVAKNLQRKADFEVVGEAADGLEAVQKSEGLQPDLILLEHWASNTKRDRGRQTNTPNRFPRKNTLHKSNPRSRCGARRVGQRWARIRPKIRCRNGALARYRKRPS